VSRLPIVLKQRIFNTAPVSKYDCLDKKISTKVVQKSLYGFNYARRARNSEVTFNDL
jgi:hypothetical protein